MDEEEEEAQQNNTDNQNLSAFQALVNGALSSSLEKLTSQSRAIPAGKDFHFYNNFDKFRSPNRDFYQKSRELLQGIGSSNLLFGKHPGLPEDHDDAYDWLVNVNDDFAERFGIAMDEFFSSRKEMEASGGRSAMEDGGFQVVCGKNKKMKNGRESVTGSIEVVKSDVKVASRDQRTDMARTKVPFHLPNIARPQDVYTIRVNNSNQQFDHVWLERSEDGSRFIHPLEKLSVNDFVDRGMGENIPVKPLSLEETPFKFVEEVKDLKELAFKLRDANEFAVDLEHNQYRTFQGLTCLMQISTRTEDFLVDTLKLRVHIGPYLREVFKDPFKRKVMHGADSDIVWLQRDFGIYVCNLFDTGQASRVLNLERNSLAHLLDHYCNVTANKEYQNAEWRLRPLPREMIKYAREDTHYLLYIYDVMRLELLSVSSDSENDSAITEVYRRGYDICMNLYEKELLTDTSYLYIYGLREADFNSQQLAVVAGLFSWRDTVARAEDESTGYILPNRALLEIARRMPITVRTLRKLVKSKNPILERYLGSIVTVIRKCMQNASAFESVAEELKRERLERISEQNNPTVPDEAVSQTIKDPGEGMPQIVKMDIANSPPTEKSEEICLDATAKVEVRATEYGSKAPLSVHLEGERRVSTYSLQSNSSMSPCETHMTTVTEHVGSENSLSSVLPKVNVASVEVLKKPNGAFGALLGNSKKKSSIGLKSRSSDQEMAVGKLEQIKSSVSLPFHSFSGADSTHEKIDDINLLILEDIKPKLEDTDMRILDYQTEEIIPLENELRDPQMEVETSGPDQAGKDLADGSADLGLGAEEEKEPVSLAELSRSFQKCLDTVNQSKRSAGGARSRQHANSHDDSIQFKPFDYEAARREMNFMGSREEEAGVEGDDGTVKKSKRPPRKNKQVKGQVRQEPISDFQMPRRRQVFPPSGNRSGTFR